MVGMYDTAALKASIASVDCSCNQAVAFATLNPERADSRYVYYALLIGREHFRRLRRGIRQKNLNLSMVRQIEIPLPRPAEQQKFATRLQELSALKESMHRASHQIDDLFASIQHRAFRAGL